MNKAIIVHPEYITCKKYITEHCDDPIYYADYCKRLNYHIGKPYDIIIILPYGVDKQNIDFTNIKTIRATGPVRSYVFLGRKIQISSIDIMVPITWVNQCFDLLLKIEHINKLQYEIYCHEPKILLPEEQSDLLFEEGTVYFDVGNLIEALKKYKACIRVTHRIRDCIRISKEYKPAFKIACIYAKSNSLETIELAFKWLEVAYQLGYRDWNHAMIDADLSNLH